MRINAISGATLSRAQRAQMPNRVWNAPKSPEKAPFATTSRQRSTKTNWDTPLTGRSDTN